MLQLMLNATVLLAGKLATAVPVPKKVVDAAATPTPSGRPAGQEAPPWFKTQVTVLQTTPAEVASLTTVPLAADGPLLTNVTV